MPSLSSLKKAKMREEFIKDVVENVKKYLESTTDINDGIRTSDELYNHLVKGREVPFNYKRLIEEAKNYE